MKLNSNKLNFSIFLIFSAFVFYARAKLDLDRSDSNAFKIIQSDLGVYDHHPSFCAAPCNCLAVSCESRIFSLKITRIVYDNKQLDGSVGPEIGLLSELRELILASNYLVGRLPREIVDCRKLEVLNLRNNLFSGNVPSEISKLVNLRLIDLSGNRFSGDLTFLKYFPNLETLSLTENLFSGKIPSSVRPFHTLHLDISVNDSTRRILSSSRGASEVSHIEHESKKTLATWLIGLVLGGGLGFFSGLTISVFVKVGMRLTRGRENSYGIQIFSSLIKKAEFLAFLEKDDGVSGLQVIGKGGCGEVYKAELPGSNGKLIAIKKITHSSDDGEDVNEGDSRVLSSNLRQIRAEIKTIGRIRHCNVLPLLAHVSRPDCHYLVYDFLKNGSLQDKMAQIVEGNSTEFDWLTRYKIALGVATGIEYLHMNNSPRIVHRDLKPGNILLDDEMEPRISDFGLAKEMGIGKSHVSTLKVVGTLGYIAPEYHQTYRFTEKSDVYSFGVVLGSLVIGKLPCDEFFQDTEEMHLVTWMRNVMNSEDPTAAVDPTMRGNGYEEQMLQVLRIACFCTVEDPKERPNGKDIRCMLSQISH
ncbi:hypothetical protein RND81_01G150200 [Saponaria officinalis]|uniref:Protein kinase domain-containing protein n=1 Tax=Saponaria officinalis TaxID=3572 RepID=A0AAW1N7U3_SAPOF